MMTELNHTPKIIRAVDDIRHHVSTQQRQGLKVALVPTMGALHEGHLSLITHARQFADSIVVSLFVNPTQFGEGEDFDTYPRTFETDVSLLRDHAVELVYAPTVETMYPKGFATNIHVNGPALSLETDYRPHFFQGVATVVSKLLLSCLPDYAVFGEKDYQQLLVISQMVRDLHIPCTIKAAPTMREADGLAMSSRNRYLTQEERNVAARLPAVMQQCAAEIRDGMSAGAACDTAIKTLTETGFDVDYVALRNAMTLAPIMDQNTEPRRLLAAARIGRTRLIDNIAV